MESIPDKSSPSISMWLASQGANSVLIPVRILTTPAGRSEVANTSASVIAARGRLWLAISTEVLPPAIIGARLRTKPIRESFSSATIPITPKDSGIVKL